MESDTEQKSEWSSKRLLEWTSGHFAKAGVEQGRLCAEILLGHVLGCGRIDLYVNFNYCPNPDQLSQFRELVRRCAGHEPTGYLTGKAYFYSLELAVRRAVLIPRPETETLVTEAIDFLRKQYHRPTVDVLDLGTGSGCIAIAIAANVIEADVIATDHSREALEVARENIESHDLKGRITLIESDLFDGMSQAQKQIFDLIVSNPPYISAEQFDKLDANVRDYEPREALLAGVGGLEYHQRIVEGAEGFLADSGALMVEVAYDQAEQVVELFEKSGYLDNITTVKDHLGHHRVVRANKK